MVSWSVSLRAWRVCQYQAAAITPSTTANMTNTLTVRTGFLALAGGRCGLEFCDGLSAKVLPARAKFRSRRMAELASLATGKGTVGSFSNRVSRSTRFKSERISEAL